jgi:hypothetical protein
MNPEILHPLSTAIETTLLTTIHLINGDRIITDASEDENDTNYENGFGELLAGV